VFAKGQLCTGTLIKSDRVLTAGSCVDGSETAGTWFGDVHRGSAGEIYREANSIVIHPQYVVNSRIHDLAVLKLHFAYDMSETIQSIQLPINNINDFANKKAIASGFGETSNGSTSYLMWGTFSVFDIDLCKIVLNLKETAADADKLICGNNIETSTCHGDSGGPLAYYDDKGGWQLIGISSKILHNSCYSAYYPSIFVRVSEYLDWINSI
jgi:secreted trypsin-like serine protease